MLDRNTQQVAWCMAALTVASLFPGCAEKANSKPMPDAAAIVGRMEEASSSQKLLVESTPITLEYILQTCEAALVACSEARGLVDGGSLYTSRYKTVKTKIMESLTVAEEVLSSPAALQQGIDGTILFNACVDIGELRELIRTDSLRKFFSAGRNSSAGTVGTLGRVESSLNFIKNILQTD